MGPSVYFDSLKRIQFIIIPPPLSKKEGHIALHMWVGLYVGIPTPCATDNSRMFCPGSFKLGT